jgi:hypothetical protein
MHKQILNSANTIRFRRWSRVGYAVFCSLACSVTIGCVANSISEKSLQKSVGTTSTVRVMAVDADSDEKESPELEAALQQVQETTFIQTTFDSAAACGQISLYIFIHYSG